MVGILLILSLLPFTSNQTKAASNKPIAEVLSFIRHKNTDPEAVLFLHVFQEGTFTPDPDCNIKGVWTFSINGKRVLTRHVEWKGSKGIPLSLKNLNPDQPNTIHYTFHGQIDGKSFFIDENLDLPSYELRSQNTKLTLVQSPDMEKQPGKMMIKLTNQQNKPVHTCMEEKTTQLTCDLSKLSQGTYQVTAIYTSAFAFRKTGTLKLNRNGQSQLTLQPADKFPSPGKILDQYDRDRWMHEWKKWTNERKKSPLYPTLDVKTYTSKYTKRTKVKLITPTAYKETKKKLFIAFYNEKKEVIDYCQMNSILYCNTPPDAKTFMLLFANKNEHNQPLGIEQHGRFINNKISLSSPKYTINPKQIEAKMEETKKKKITPKQINIWNYINVIIFLCFIFGISFIYLVIRIRRRI